MICPSGSIPLATFKLNILRPVSKELSFWGKHVVSKRRAGWEEIS